VSLLQRIRTPFGEATDEGTREPNPGGQAVGSLLRRRREELGLDLDQVGEALRIKPGLLAALEEGRPQELPGPTYAVGFIRTYSHYLGLDSDLVLKRYKETAEAPAPPDLTLPAPLRERSLPGGRILLIGLILALCGYGTWYYLATGENARPERVAAVPASLQPLLDKAGPTSAAARGSDPGGADTPALAAPPQPSWAAQPAGDAAPAPPAQTEAAVTSGATAADPHIDIRAVADSWVQIRAADDTIVFSRVLKAGETYHVPRTGLLLRTGNAGALAIAVDGKPAPPLGPAGALRRNVALDPEALLTGKAARG
jgi:cytoskeleton protein RodZ